MNKIIFILSIFIIAFIDVSSKEMSPDAIEGIYTIRYRSFTFDHIVYIDDDSLYVPLSRVLDNLKMYYNMSETGKLYEGYCLKPDSSFYFDFDDLEAKFINKEYKILDKQYFISGPEVYVTPNLISTVFDFDSFIYDADLIIYFRSFYDLPVYADYKRKMLESNAGFADNGFYNLLYDRERKWIGGGMMDYNMGANHFGGQNRFNYTGTLGMQLLGGDLNVSNFGNYFQDNDEFFNKSFFAWRFFVSDNPYLTQINVGDITNAGIRTSTLPNMAIRGARISNEQTQLPTQFSQYTIQDITTPGTRVELYVNNIFKNSVDADEYGNYRFDLPVYYGNTNVQLRFYGTDGEYDEKDFQFNIENQFLQPGEIRYTASAGERELDKQFIADGRVAVGVTDWLTTTFGTDNNLQKFNNPSFEASQFNYFNHTAIRLGKNVTTSFDVYFEQLYSGNLRMFYRNIFTLNGSYTSFDGVSIYNPGNVKERFDLNIGLPNIFGLPINLFGNAYRLNMENYSSTVLFSSMMLNFNPVFLNFRYFRNQNDFQDDQYLSQNLSAELSFSWNNKPKFLDFLKSTRFSIFTDYDIEVGDFIRYGVGLNQNLYRWANLQANYTRSMLGNFDQFSVNLVFNLPSFQSNSNINYVNNQSVYNTNLNGTVGFDPQNMDFHFNNPIFQNAVGQGAAKFRFFLDDNGNGNYDEGEKKIDNVRFSVENGQLERSFDNKPDIAYNLAPYGRFNVVVEPNSFENPLWIPTKTNFSFVADPNTYKPIDVPCYAGGVIEGSVAKKIGKLTEYQSGVKVHIMADDSSFHETVPVFSDGTFYKMGVPPGEYKAWVDKDQLDILGMVQDDDFLVFNIEKTTYGDFAGEIDFTLRYEGELASDDLAIDDNKTDGLDNINVDEKDEQQDNIDEEIDIASNEEIDKQIEKEIADPINIDEPENLQEKEIIQPINDPNEKFVIYFSDKESRAISNNSQQTLNRVVEFLRNNQSYNVGLIGHTDIFASMNDHLTISRERANAAKDYLISQGIAPNRIFSRGVGALEPAENNSTEQGRKLNRRVEINLIK